MRSRTSFMINNSDSFLSPLIITTLCKSNILRIAAKVMISV